MLIETNRRYIIRQSPGAPVACAQCGESMLRVEQTAVFFKTSQRRIFLIIKAGAAHFTETEAGAAMICLTFLASVLKDQSPEDQKSRLDKLSEPPS